MKAPAKRGRPKRKKGFAKKDTLDAVFSWLIRERADWTCEKCGKNFRHDAGKLHCSHFYSRRHQSVRFSPLNAAAHCVSCHWQFGHAPIEFGAWIRTHLGIRKENELVQRKGWLMKRTPADKAELLEKMRETKAWMQEQRDNGATGRLEFECTWE
jgi:hypothetical protein